MPTGEALNTGILCDGLRAIDVDIDDAAIAAKVEALAVEMLGLAPVRVHGNSSRRMMLYRAAEGTPKKVTVSGTRGSVEALGQGQQFVFAGFHPDGSEYQWLNGDPAPYPASMLRPITEAALGAFLSACGSPIGAKPTEAQAKAPSPVSVPSLPSSRPSATEHERSVAAKALRDHASTLAAVSNGRNVALNSAALPLGEMIAAGWIEQTTVESALWEACAANGYRAKDGDTEAWATLQSGLQKGMSQPRPALPIVSDTDGIELRRRMTQSTEASPLPFSIDSIPSVFSFDSRDIEWAVPHLIAFGAITMISGDAGSGKSSFITAAADHIASGHMFLSRPAHSVVKCLYLDRENSLPVAQERFRRLKVNDGGNFKYYGSHLNGEVPLPGDPAIVEWVKSNGKVVIFVDSLIAFFQGSENSSNDVRAFMQQLRDLANLGAAVVVLHHTGKGESTQEYRGSSDFKAGIDVGYVLRNYGGARLTNLNLTTFKARFTVIDVPSMSYESGTFTCLNSPDALRTDLLAMLQANPACLKSEFEKLAIGKGFNRGKVRQFIDDGVASGLIQSLQGEKNAQRLTAVEPPSLPMLM